MGNRYDLNDSEHGTTNGTTQNVGAKHSQCNLVSAEPRLIANASPLTRYYGYSDSPFQKIDPTLANFAGDGTVAGPVAAIVRNFKTVSTRKINQARRSPGCCVGQRGYYEHILRDEKDMGRTREYIVFNPACWEDDGLKEK